VGRLSEIELTTLGIPHLQERGMMEVGVSRFIYLLNDLTKIICEVLENRLNLSLGPAKSITWLKGGANLSPLKGFGYFTQIRFLKGL